VTYLGVFTHLYRHRALVEWTDICEARHLPHTPMSRQQSSSRSSSPSAVEDGKDSEDGKTNTKTKSVGDGKAAERGDGGGDDGPSILTVVMSDPVTVRQWTVQGLPTDAFSVDNAVMAFRSRRWPLLIDPQEQGAKWVRSMCQADGLRLTTAMDAHCVRTVTGAIELGLPVLIDNLTESAGQGVLAPLEPLFLRSTFKQGGVTCLRISDKVVEFVEETFMMWLVTRLPNPHFLPEVLSKFNVINFMITPEGLTDQLLTALVKAERPSLAETQATLIVQGAKNAVMLRRCEDQVLHVLASSTGNILDDEGAVSALQSSKAASDDIAAKQRAAAETEMLVKAVRAGYLPVAMRGTHLFFVIASLPRLGSSYQFSLEWFIALFTKAIHSTKDKPREEDGGEEDDIDISAVVAAAVASSDPFGVGRGDGDLDDKKMKKQGGKEKDGEAEVDPLTFAKRLGVIRNGILHALYHSVSRALSHRHRLVFTFIVASTLGRHEGFISSSEWSSFVEGPRDTTDAPSSAGARDGGKVEGDVGSGASTGNGGGSDALVAMVVAARWLEGLPGGTFDGLCRSIVNDAEGWTRWIACVEQGGAFRDTAPPFMPLTDFQQLQLVRALCPRGLVAAMRGFAERMVGELVQADTNGGEGGEMKGGGGSADKEAKAESDDEFALAELAGAENAGVGNAGVENVGDVAAVGRSFLDMPTLQLTPLLEESTPASPLIFVLANGAEPTAMLSSFATSMASAWIETTGECCAEWQRGSGGGWEGGGGGGSTIWGAGSYCTIQI
jgi:hypothetical protein